MGTDIRWTLASGIALELVGALLIWLGWDAWIPLVIVGFAVAAAGGIYTMAATVAWGVFLGLRAHNET